MRGHTAATTSLKPEEDLAWWGRRLRARWREAAARRGWTDQGGRRGRLGEHALYWSVQKKELSLLEVVERQEFRMQVGRV